VDHYHEFTRLQREDYDERRFVMENITTLNQLIEETNMIEHLLAAQRLVTSKLETAIGLVDWRTGLNTMTTKSSARAYDSDPNYNSDNAEKEAKRCLREIMGNISDHLAQLSRIRDAAKSARATVKFNYCFCKEDFS
jgi:hypothetical protein